jgi:hypothetical protein
MRSVLICLFGIASTLLGVALPSPAGAQLPDGMLTVYSNICFNPGSGDLNGLRIIVFRSATWRGSAADPPRDRDENIYVFYQETAGLLAVPLHEPATVQGDQMRIDLHFPDRSMRTFLGRITPETIDGRYADGNGPPHILLKRVPSPVNKFSGC